MKQKRTRDLTEKTENSSKRNAPAHRENVLCPKAPTENASGRERREADVGVPHVRFKSSPAPEGCGGHRRRTTASQGDRSVPRVSACPSTSVGGGLGRRRAPRRWRSQLRRMVVRARLILSDGSCNLQIRARVSEVDALGGYWHGLRGGGART